MLCLFDSDGVLEKQASVRYKSCLLTVQLPNRGDLVKAPERDWNSDEERGGKLCGEALHRSAATPAQTPPSCQGFHMAASESHRHVSSCEARLGRHACGGGGGRSVKPLQLLAAAAPTPAANMLEMEEGVFPNRLMTGHTLQNPLETAV